MKHWLLGFLIVLAYSCDNTGSSSTAYFGGEIVNPREKYVILFHNDEPVDTAMLDHNNRFLFKLENVSEGLYNFKHKPEYQYVILEKGDSVLIRLNTLDFDESLVFSGKGAEKNNFLIDMFLFNEDEEKLIYDYYNLDGAHYLSKMDSLKAMKMEQYENLVKNFNVSPLVERIARASVDYNHYSSMEIYPYMHKKVTLAEDFPTVPANFYAYRDQIDYNDKDLSYFRPYLNFMVMHFNHMSYVDCKKDCKHPTEIVEKSLHYHTHKLKLIDSLVQESNLRDNLFRNAAYTYLFEDHDTANNEQFIAEFNSLSHNNRHFEEINQLYQGIKSLSSGKEIPQVTLVNMHGDTKSTKDACKNKKTVYYFWSLNQMNHMKNIYSRISELKEEHPEYRYVGINVNDDHERWVHTLNEMKLDTTAQYRCANFEDMQKKLVLYGLNKIIITNGDGTIVDAFANAYDYGLEHELQRDSQLVKL